MSCLELSPWLQGAIAITWIYGIALLSIIMWRLVKDLRKS